MSSTVLISLFQWRSCARTSPHPASWNVFITAKWLYLELWGKDLGSILEQVPDCSEKYVSRTKITQLHLDKLGYRENALLIREEYITAIDMLEGPFQPHNAVVITGQPGIGVLCTSFKPIFLTSPCITI